MRKYLRENPLFIIAVLVAVIAIPAAARTASIQLQKRSSLPRDQITQILTESNLTDPRGNIITEGNLDSLELGTLPPPTSRATYWGWATTTDSSPPRPN